MSRLLVKKLKRLNLFSFGKDDRKEFSSTLLKNYNVDSVLGTGGFGTVYAGVGNSDGRQVAIKHIAKSRVIEWVEVNGQSLPVEIVLLQRLKDVAGVVQLLEYFVDETSFVLVLERPCPSRDLFDYITERGHLDETEARGFVEQLIHILIKVHDAGVIHRDLKDENILVELDTGRLRLIDFGSGTFYKDTLYTEFDGTRVYSPPEWIQRHSYHGLPATMWSIGILLYDMICGDIPFQTDDEVVQAKICFHKDISSDACDLIRRCLSIDPTRRPSSFDEVLSHPWMNLAGSCSD